MKKALFILAACIAACGYQSEHKIGTKLEQPSSFIRADRKVENEYIVVFSGDHAPGKVKDKDVRDAAKEKAGKHNGKLKTVYTHALRGFATEMTEQEALALADDPDIHYVAENQIVTLTATQPAAPWGLDRIDQRDLPLSGTYEYTRTGAGVNVYVIDSGIRASHTEFGGRVQPGLDTIQDGVGTGDCLGHGTHVAGTIAGSTYGVAKNALLYPLRVFGCGSSGTMEGILQAIDWVTANHRKPAVANMSLISGVYQPMDDAVANSIRAGVTYVVAAGNSNANACEWSPAHVAEAITVGASDVSDARAWFSNHGSCVDLFAPGVDVLSATMNSDTDASTMSGTSMATPHVAGTAALFLEANPAATPAEVEAAINAGATQDKITDPMGTANRLLYASLVPGAPQPAPNMLMNPGYDDSRHLLGWWTYGTALVSVGTGAGAYEGPGYAVMTLPKSGEHTLAQSVELLPRRTYRLSVYVRAKAKGVWGVRAFGTNAVIKDVPFAASAAYQKLEMTFNSGENLPGQPVRVYVHLTARGANNGWVNVDAWSLTLE